jgi:hypothetical protein
MRVQATSLLGEGCGQLVPARAIRRTEKETDDNERQAEVGDPRHGRTQWVQQPQ